MMDCGETDVLVNVNVAGTSPATDAVTLYVPVTLLAVIMGDVAMPSAFVVAVADALPPNVARAPVEGAVNVSVNPGTGLEEASITLACRAVVNAVPTVVLCRVPENVRMNCCGPLEVFTTGSTAIIRSPK
jgi:hypothetical protein